MENNSKFQQFWQKFSRSLVAGVILAVLGIAAVIGSAYFGQLPAAVNFIGGAIGGFIATVGVFVIAKCAKKPPSE
ncbi:MAG: hypothetical protein FWH20_00080 [Oscillospiraceae bacterium]|nr:hypothetical protein [Oscillospiraceae bacterium]